jgi:hypothetical protein
MNRKQPVLLAPAHCARDAAPRLRARRIAELAMQEREELGHLGRECAMTAFEHDSHQLGILESFWTGCFLLLRGAPHERPLSLVSGSRGKIGANSAGHAKHREKLRPGSVTVPFRRAREELRADPVQDCASLRRKAVCALTQIRA